MLVLAELDENTQNYLCLPSTLHFNFRHDCCELFWTTFLPSCEPFHLINFKFCSEKRHIEFKSCFCSPNVILKSFWKLVYFFKIYFDVAQVSHLQFCFGIVLLRALKRYGFPPGKSQHQIPAQSLALSEVGVTFSMLNMYKELIWCHLWVFFPLPSSIFYMQNMLCP